MNDRRQEIYDRIRASSKQEFILQEMIRLGFWTAEGLGPGDLASDLQERTRLEGELRALRTEQSRLQQEEAVLRALRKRRLDESRRKRAETKARREAERQRRAADWAARKTREILYLGPEVSGGLNHTTSDAELLARHGLPHLDDPASLASAMEIAVGELRFLAFTRAVSQTSHYVRYHVPKRTGGLRLISAPQPRLKAAQSWILTNVLEKVEVHPAAHGFVPGHSTVTNAVPHVGRGVVVNLDLKDFFPTVTYRRVYGQFRKLGYSPAVATVMALLCTEPDVEQVELDGRTWHVANGERHLPQGAPTSPALTNLLCRRLDRKLSSMAGRLGFTYTRYADDLTFSAEDGPSEAVGTLLRRTRYLVRQEGFEVHPDKTRVLRPGRRQEVTGVVVNRKPNLDRRTLKRFRALLFQLEKDGLEGKVWNPGVHVLASAMGFANYVNMVDPEKGRELRRRVAVLCRRHGFTPVRKVAPPPAAPQPPVPPPPEREKKRPWWKIW